MKFSKFSTISEHTSPSVTSYFKQLNAILSVYECPCTSFRHVFRFTYLASQHTSFCTAGRFCCCVANRLRWIDIGIRWRMLINIWNIFAYAEHSVNYNTLGKNVNQINIMAIFWQVLECFVSEHIDKFSNINRIRIACHYYCTCVSFIIGTLCGVIAKLCN